MVPLIVMIFIMGVYPNPFIDKMEPAVKKLVSQVRPASHERQKMPVAMPAAAGGHIPAMHGTCRPLRHACRPLNRMLHRLSIRTKQVIHESIRPEDILDGHDY